jgi:drug/metabolite transporter (DMT)-like permease
LPANVSITVQRPDKDAPAWLVWAALGVVYVVWGSTYLAIRVTVETLPPLLGGAARFLLAGPLMYAWLRLRRGPHGVRVSTPELLACAMVGSALLLGGNGLVMIAEQRVPSGLAALIIAAAPLWIVVLRVTFGDAVKKTTLAGVAAGLVGVGILVLPGSKAHGAPLAGTLLLVAASGMWAGGSFFSKRLPLPEDPFTSTAWQMICGGIALTLAGLATGELSDIDVDSFSDRSLWALAYLVVIGSLGAFTAYTWVLQHAPISKVATYAYVNPVIAVVLGWAILSEDITATIALGAMVIVASVAFIVRHEAPPQLQTAESTDALAEPALSGQRGT